jgi:hypothetical protein
VHQQGTPAAVHVPLGDDTVSQLPTGHDHASGVALAVSQASLSAVPLPVQVPVHCSFASTHFRLEQAESATHRHAVPLLSSTGAGVNVVVHPVPALLVHGTELGASSQLCSSAGPDPVQLDPHSVLLPPSPDTDTHLPLSH